MEPPSPATPTEAGASPDPLDEPEHRVIRTILAAAQGVELDPARCPPPRVGPGDDAAVLADGQTITIDTLVEGVHFNARLSGADVGFKTLAVSVSDLAAMGARAEWAVLAIALPRPIPQAWVSEFAAGLAEACARWGVRLVGGDTTRSPGPIVLSLTLGGRCVARPLRRDGARPGEDLWVTGVPGLAAAGYALEAPAEAALFALRRPEPPVAFALALAAAGLATAAMDLSDGLASDLPRLCAASGCGARVDASRLPPHPALDPHPQAPALRLAGGDDYQLLFAAPAAEADAVRELAATHGVHISRIGRFTADPSVRLSEGVWPQPPFSHFGEVAP